MNNFISHGILDREISELIYEENQRQNNTISLIASENLASTQIRHVQSSLLTNKYAEGYPGKRYYGGCEVVDKIETLCQKRVCELFGVKYANVQPHSGSQANMAIFTNLLNPGDTILGMDLSSGGHLTHGSKVNFSGKIYNSIAYGLNSEEIIDMNQVEELALKHKPKIIIAGTSAYSRVVDWAKFREIADKVGAIFLADMAHVAGLVAAGKYPSPINIADIITSTTHKTLKGPRGGIILTNNQELFKKVNKGIFPGIQGGPLMNTIAAKAICFNDALSPEYKHYIENVINNSKVICEELAKDFEIVSGGTDTHLFIMKTNHLSGKDAEQRLSDVGIILNKNMISNDSRSPMETSGIRIGSPSGTSRGFGEKEFKQIGSYIRKVLKDENIDEIKLKVQELCNKFPVDKVTS